MLSSNLLARSRGLLQRRWRALHTSRATFQAPKKPENAGMTPESMEKFFQMAESNQLGFDPWGQPMPTLDLHVPPSWTTLKDTSLRDRLKFMQLGLENRVSNTVAMFRIARSHSLPWNPTASPYSLQIFRTTSTKPNTWLEPLREIALNSYERINTAVSTNDLNGIRTLTDGAYQKRQIARAKALHPSASATSSASSKKAAPRLNHVWRLHSLASPVRCVSIRGVQGHFGRTEPLLGTRWVVQACLRFDTWQSLGIYSPTSSVSPEVKRVLEYLVFEKRMWYDGPWIVRGQLWEGILGHYQSATV